MVNRIYWVAMPWEDQEVYTRKGGEKKAMRKTGKA